MNSLRLTPTVKFLLFSCVLAFVLQKIGDQGFDLGLLSTFGLVPLSFVLQFKFWQIITYAFLHGDIMHLVFNLMMIVFIGADLEALWGKRRFAIFYVFCAVFTGAFYLFLVFLWKDAGLRIPLVGASGAIYGMLVAYGILFSERVMLFMMLFPMKAKHFVIVLGLIELFTGLFSGQISGLSSIAHLGGIFGGLVYLYGVTLWRSQSKKRALKNKWSALQRPRSTRNHLKLIVNNAKDKKAIQESFEKAESPDGDDPKNWN